MNQEVVGINRIVRCMRGGSQSQLIQGHDGRFYVAKFRGNPQGNRTLINEFVATNLLHRLGISTPPLTLLAYDPCSSQKAVSFRIGNDADPIVLGLHLGSLCPVDPNKQAIYDFLPRKLLEKTVNLEDFAGILVADTFLNQMDRRQAIFVRVDLQRDWHSGLFSSTMDWPLGEAPGSSKASRKTILTLTGWCIQRLTLIPTANAL